MITRSPLRAGLGLRIALLIAIILPLTVGGLVWIVVDMQRENLERKAMHGAERFSDALRLSARQAMLRNHREDLQFMIEAASKAPEVLAVRIINKAGAVTYSSRPEEIGRNVDLKAEACVVCHRDEALLTHPENAERMRIFQPEKAGPRVMGFITPIRNEPGCATAACHAHPQNLKILGVVDIQVSLADIDAMAEKDRRKFLGFLFAWVFVLAAAAALAGHWLVARPVRTLAAACQKLARREFGDPLPDVPATGINELEDLAEGFNLMASRLAAAQEDLERKVVDRTRRLRDAEDQLIRSEKLGAMGVLAAGIAHELNNPLTGIVTFCHVLLRSAVKGGDDERRLKRIVAEAERCSHIVAGLIDVARPLSGEKDEVFAARLVRDTIRLIDEQNVHSTMRIEARLEAALDKILLPNSALRQVIINVARNAAEAGASELVIEGGVSFENEQSLMTLRFDDNGPGIPEEIRRRIFDPFFTTKDVGQGSGLGLWMSYRIVTELNGRIEATSTARGGRFEVTIPVAFRNS